MINSTDQDQDLQTLKINLLLKENEIRALKLKINPNDEIDRLNQEILRIKELNNMDMELLRQEN